MTHDVKYVIGASRDYSDHFLGRVSELMLLLLYNEMIIPLTGETGEDYF